jgi:hypothetical protein
MSIVTCYKNVSSIKPIAYTKYNVILDKIKSNQDDRIDKLRELEETSQEFKHIKESLPCVTWAGKLTFRRNTFVKDLSGLLYFDIDDNSIQRSDIKSIPEVIAFWKSVSGKGWGLIVGTRGLSIDNFRSTYESFLTEYDLPIDKLPDPARLNIISKDRDLYINDDYREYLAVEPEPVVVNPVQKLVVQSAQLQEYLLYQDWNRICGNAMRHCEKRGLYYVPGMRHNFTIAYFGYTNLYGVGYQFACQYVESRIVVSSLFASKGYRVYESYSDQFGLYQYDRNYLQNNS